jgi:hypothetical protein
MLEMRISLPSLTALSAASVMALANVRAADPLPPTPPGGSVAPPSSSPSAGSAQQNPPNPTAGNQSAHGKHLEKLRTELGLTPEQVKKMRPILKTAHEQAKTVRENASLNEQQKRQKMHQIFEAAFHQFKPILTPAQIAKLKQLRAERHGATST